MKKRGSSHIDWVISMGLFIVYVVGLFVFLRPGVVVEHKPQALLDNLEKNIKEEITINVKETPLFVGKCMYNTEILGSSVIEVEDVNNPKHWEFIKITSGVEEYSGGGSFSLTCDGSAEFPEFSDKLFNLVYIPKEKYPDTEDITPKINVKCNSYTPCNPQDLYTYAELRATVNSYYVYENWISSTSDLKTYWLGDNSLTDKEAYDELKLKFGFPEERNFAIYFLKDGDTLDNTKPIISGPKEIEESNVYVLTWKDGYINHNYEKGDIVVHIEVW